MQRETKWNERIKRVERKENWAKDFMFISILRVNIFAANRKFCNEMFQSLARLAFSLNAAR